MKWLLLKLTFILIYLLFVFPNFVYAQEEILSDSTNLSPSDTSDITKDRSLFENRLSRANKDTILTESVKPVDVGIDTSVVFSARTFHINKAERITYLINNAVVKYKNVTIGAGKITVLWNENTIIAEGLPDTSNSNNPTDGDSLKIKNNGLPIFSDGKETIRGEKMEYNFKTERGRVIRGRGEIEGGYYFGDAIKRVTAKEFNISNGIYSTCNKEEPHFHFKGKKMKIILDDKVIAKPVIFFIGKIPIALVPFIIHSTKAQRQSGIIIPQYGSSSLEGRYLRNLGYYWAASEYFDARFTLDFFEKTGILFRTHMTYALRYNFRGSVSGSFTRKNFSSGTRQRRWDFSIRHSQTINPTTNLSVNASFVSNNSFYREFSQNRNQRLSRQLISNATFTKRWSEGKNSITLNLSQTKDLETGSSAITLPQIRFTRNQSAIFPFKHEKQARVSGRANEKPKWYNFLRYDYKGFFVNSVKKDSTGDPDADVKRRAEHALNFSFTNPKKIFGWLSINQTLRYKEDWFDRTKTFSLDVSTNDTLETEDKGFAARRIFSLSVSANTKLYGTFFPNIGSIKTIRHVMTPTMTFSYQPDFSDRFWGYFQSLQDTSGKDIPGLDRFGGTPSGERKSLSFGLSNLFQMKLGEGEKEKKIDLFNLNFNGGYNFAADNFNWNDLRTTFRANPRKNLGISMGMTHSFYDYDPETGNRVNKLLFNKKGIFNFLRLTRFQLDARWSLSGRRKSAKQNGGGQSSTGKIQGAESLPIEQVDHSQLQNGDEVRDRFQSQSAFSAFDIPWRATVSFSYSVNKFNPTRPSRNAYIDLSNVEVQLTKKWRIGYRFRYDIENSKIADQRISIYRDLHCWEAQFNWNPSGIGRGFYFKINIKAPHLRQIKIEQRGGTTSVFSPF
ncbi:MAG: putative LPS assembly protein LptD [bacterium]